jgi:hypothetical protein
MRKRNAENMSQRALHMAAYQLRTCLRLSNDGVFSNSHSPLSITLIRQYVCRRMDRHYDGEKVFQEAAQWLGLGSGGWLQLHGKVGVTEWSSRWIGRDGGKWEEHLSRTFVGYVQMNEC